jgi:hypothetical protein
VGYKITDSTLAALHSEDVPEATLRHGQLWNKPFLKTLFIRKLIRAKQLRTVTPLSVPKESLLGDSPKFHFRRFRYGLRAVRRVFCRRVIGREQASDAGTADRSAAQIGRLASSVI